MKISKEFIKYCLVGIVNTIVGTGTAFIALDFFGCNYAVSTTLAYVTGNISSFYLNKTFTFKSKGNTVFEFFKFFLTMLPSYVFSYWAGYKICRYLLSLGFFDFINNFIKIKETLISDNIAIPLSMLIYLILGFTINKFLVFNKK